MINENVIHKSFGQGTILEMTEDTITIDFNNLGVKKLAIPISFQNEYLQLENTDKQTNYLEKVKKQREIDKKRSIDKQILEVSAPQCKPVAINDLLLIGSIYSNKEITTIFKCSPQMGMRRSLKTNSLVLVSIHSKNHEQNPYEDRWEADGLFHYTGMGLTGDQDLEYMQNKTLYHSNENGVNVYLFESFKKNEYIFKGEVILAKEPYTVTESDSTGSIRKVYKFPLALL